MRTLKEAAPILGYTVKGLRKIVDRSRKKARGEKITGPVIGFFQACPHGPIKFTDDQLEDFVERYSIDPVNAVHKPKLKKVVATGDHGNW